MLILPDRQLVRFGEEILDVVMNFIRANLSPEDVFGEKEIRDHAVMVVSENLYPDDVFDEAVLTGWAIDHDFSKPEE